MSCSQEYLEKFIKLMTQKNPGFKKYSRFQKNIPGCKKIFQVVRILLTWEIFFFPGYSLKKNTAPDALGCKAAIR